MDLHVQILNQTWYQPGKLYIRDVIKQYTASELLGSLYLNDTHKI